MTFIGDLSDWAKNIEGVSKNDTKSLKMQKNGQKICTVHFFFVILCGF